MQLSIPHGLMAVLCLSALYLNLRYAERHRNYLRAMMAVPLAQLVIYYLLLWAGRDVPTSLARTALFFYFLMSCVYLWNGRVNRLIDTVVRGAQGWIRLRG